MYTATDSIFFAASCPTTWLSRKLLISNGLGIEFNSKGIDLWGFSTGNFFFTCAELGYFAWLSSNSSSRISLQRSMHSSQM